MGTTLRDKRSILRWSASMHVASSPFSARHVPVTHRPEKKRREFQPRGRRRKAASHVGRTSVQAIREAYGIAPSAKTDGTTIDDVGQVLAPLTATPDLLTPIIKISDALWSNLGVRGQKRYSQEFHDAYPPVAARFLQALGHHDCPITALGDTATGCFVEAKQPSDVFSLRGVLAADVIAVSPRLVRIEVAAETKGQIFDWGQDRRLIDQIFERTRYYLTKM